jgi:hypothetical protein
MALSSTQHFSDGVVRGQRGSRTGTRVAGNFTITLGFAPKYVKVTNLTDRISGEWFAESPAGTQLLTVAAGTRTYADTGITVSADSFTVVVATAGLETDNDDVVWEAS